MLLNRCYEWGRFEERQFNFSALRWYLRIEIEKNNLSTESVFFEKKKIDFE